MKAATRSAQCEAALVTSDFLHKLLSFVLSDLFMDSSALVGNTLLLDSFFLATIDTIGHRTS